MTQWMDFRRRRLIVGAAEAGLATGLAWFVAKSLLGSAPIYAPIAAVVVIGAGYVRRIERVKAMFSGMAVAIVVSEIGVGALGTGAVQIGVLTAGAVLLAQVLLDDFLAVVYAGLNAAVLVALGGDGWIPQRALEAIVGAGTAYTMVYLILPPRPETWIRGAIADQVSIARENLNIVATALRSGDSDSASRAIHDSRIDRNVTALADALNFSREVSRYSPWRRSKRDEVERLRARSVELQQVLRYTTILVRIAGRLASISSSSENRLADAIDTESEAILRMGRLIRDDEADQGVRERIDEIRALNREAVDCSEGAGDDDDLHAAVVGALRIVAEEIRDWAAAVERDLEGSVGVQEHLADR